MIIKINQRLTANILQRHCDKLFQLYFAYQINGL